jgi:hypothetical protein
MKVTIQLIPKSSVGFVVDLAIGDSKPLKPFVQMKQRETVTSSNPSGELSLPDFASVCARTIFEFQSAADSG